MDKSSNQAKKSSLSVFVFILILLAVNLFVFLPSMPGNFIWDDKQFISENQNILSRHFLKDFLTSPFGGFSGIDEHSRKTDPSLQFYRPLTSLTYWLDFKIWGLNPAGFHLTNILLHLANAVLLFYLLLNLGLSRLSSFLSALLFSVFPVHFENVSWISGRTDLLSFFWGAVSALFFLRFLTKKSYLVLLCSALFFLLALLSKENIIFLPLLYLVILYRKKPKVREVLFSFFPYALSLSVWAILRTIAFGTARSQFSGRSLLDFFASLGFYAWKIIFPFNLSMTINPHRVFGNWGYAAFGLIISFFVALLLRFLTRKKKSDFGIPVFFLAFFLFFLPSLAVIFSAATISPLGWRFLYLPSGLFVSGLVYLLIHQIKHRKIAVTICFLLTVFYAVEIYPKNRDFGRDEASFWLGIKKIEREDLIARFNIDIKLLAADEGKALRVFEDILGERDHPLYDFWKTRVYEELAIYFAFQRNFAGAEYYFQELMKTGQGLSTHATFNYAYYLAFAERTADGEKIIREKLEAFPLNHYVLTRAAKFYLIVNDYERAAELYARDYSIFPTEQTQKYLRELRGLRGEKK